MFEKCSKCQNGEWIFNISDMFGDNIVSLVCSNCNHTVNYQARQAVFDLEDEN